MLAPRNLEASEEVWVRFLNSPLATLEDYGTNTRMINSIERRYGLYIKNIQGVTMEDLLKIENCATKSLGIFQQALIKLFEEIRREEEQKWI